MYEHLSARWNSIVNKLLGTSQKRSVVCFLDHSGLALTMGIAWLGSVLLCLEHRGRDIGNGQEILVWQKKLPSRHECRHFCWSSRKFNKLRSPFVDPKWVAEAYICVMFRDWSFSRDLETWNGPSNNPGAITWHSRRISYLDWMYGVGDQQSPSRGLGGARLETEVTYLHSTSDIMETGGAALEIVPTGATFILRKKRVVWCNVCQGSNDCCGLD